MNNRKGRVKSTLFVIRILNSVYIQNTISFLLFSMITISSSMRLRPYIEQYKDNAEYYLPDMN